MDEDAGAPEQFMRWMIEGNDFFHRQTARVADADWVRDSALPGWTLKHLFAHVSLNATALGRLVRWARTGEPTPMYSDPNSRSREIEEGARWGAARLRTALEREQKSLTEGLLELPSDRWATEVTTAQGRQVQARQVPWLRSRELWIHAVDIGAGADFSDFPPEFLDHLVGEAVAKHRIANPGLQVRALDRQRVWPADSEALSDCVEGTAASLARWLTRRDPNGVKGIASGPLPELGPWL